MMRVVSLILALSLLSLVSAQEGGAKDQPQQEEKIPTTLAEAHAELERVLSPETLAEIDAMPSEGDMIKYHFGLGLNIRNGWGLWRDSALAKHMRELGFTHPDNMSGVILNTFWCKRHGQDFRLKELAASAKTSREAARKAQEEEENRAREGYAAIRKMMMGLQFEQRDVPVVRMPIRDGLSVRFMCPFRGGVFLTDYRQWPPRQGSILWDGYYVDPASDEARRRPDMDDSVSRGLYLGADRAAREMGRGDSFHTLGFYLDLKDRKIHRIHVPEVNELYASVVADDRAYFAGLSDGRAVLAGVNDQDRVTVPLPQADEIPDLGLDGQFLLAVYSKTIYRLTDRQWTVVHSGDILLPRSGLPPQRHGNMVFLRDEEISGGCKRLWWLTMGEKSRLRLLARDTGLFEPIVRDSPGMTEVSHVGPPGWEETSSYCVTSSGDLWACVASGSILLRRSKDGKYSFATVNGSVGFTGELFGPKTDQGVYVSGVTALSDGTLLLVGSRGLYRLQGNELVQELAFVRQETSDGSDTGGRRLSWGPTNVFVLDDGSYCINGGFRRGVYLLRKGDDDQWTCLPADEGDPVFW